MSEGVGAVPSHAVSIAPGLLARLIAWAAVGVIVVAAAFVVLDDGTPAPNSASRRAAAASFLDVWAKSRASTWKVDATFERTPASGTGKLSSPLEMVQRPPERLTRQFGSVTGLIDGKDVGCAPGPDGTVKCRSGGALAYDDEVATELKRLGTYVSGPVPIYAVAVDGQGCYRLDRQIEYLSPPYGDHARFCFDPKTHALVKVEVVRREATDLTTAVQVTGDVADADLALPAPIDG